MHYKIGAKYPIYKAFSPFYNSIVGKRKFLNVDVKISEGANQITNLLTR